MSKCGRLVGTGYVADPRFMNSDIARWAIEPLRGENVAMVGDSYNPQRSGWSDAAYKSSINMLNERFGCELAGQTMTLEGSVPVKPKRVRRGRSRHRP